MTTHITPRSAYAAPPVVVDDAYFDQLHGLAMVAMRQTPEVGKRLLDELERATVLPSAAMPAQVVNIGSPVTFRDNATHRVQTVTLVMPGQANIGMQRISILTPIGAALLGLMEGASIDWDTRTGERRSLTILEVADVDRAA